MDGAEDVFVLEECCGNSFLFPGGRGSEDGLYLKISLYDGFELCAEGEALLVLFALFAEFTIILFRSTAAIWVGGAADDAEVIGARELSVGVGCFGCSLSYLFFSRAILLCLIGRGLAGGCKEGLFSIRLRAADTVLATFD